MKPRNHVVLAMIKSAKKSGVHIKSQKSKRQEKNKETKKIIKEELSKINSY